MFNHSKLFDNIRNLYSLISYQRFFEKEGRAILPLRYFLELTHRCNLSCPYCYLGQNRVKDELNTKQWFKIIDEIPFFAFITFVGGEVLLREDFLDILNYASKKVFGKVNIVSNGVLLNEKMIDGIIKSKILLLSVSLDGFKHNHDKYRLKEGLFDIIDNNLNNLNKQKKKAKSNLMVDIKTIVLKDNLEDILKLYEYCIKMNFDFLSISFLRNNNLKQNPILRDNFDEEFYLKDYPIEPYFDLDEFEKIYLEIQKIKKHFKNKAPKLPVLRFAPKFDNDDPKLELNLIKKFFTQYKTKKIDEIYKPCLYPFSNIIINPIGDVYPCLSYKMGNIINEKLIDIINKPKYRCFRKNLKYSRVFSSCQMCCELVVKNS